MNSSVLHREKKSEREEVVLKLVEHENELYFKIINNNLMRPFLMSVVSDSNHWMFISGNGGLTAGRKSTDFALFPYYTDDKLTESADITGSKTIFQISVGGHTHIWEPFSERYTDLYDISRNLYKNFSGNKIIFEEVNHSLSLIFRYQWNSSNLFGFVKKSELVNISNTDCQVTVLDGIQNIVPFGVNGELQVRVSNLVDAYKRNELHAESGLGIFALSAIIVDKAEPSESLKASIAWSLGLDNPKYLLSSLQLDNFRKKQEIHQETDVKGEKGAYFVCADLVLPADTAKKWEIVANVNQDQSQVISLCKSIKENADLGTQVQKDIDLGTENLIQLVAGADGLQFTSDQLENTRHFSNVLFNIMRGGTFDNNYQIDKQDFSGYITKASNDVFHRNAAFIGSLKDEFSRAELKEALSDLSDPDMVRLCIEYLPLKYSRRHGDPSRPWNNFSINTRSEKDGSKILDYEGNWRDIFQNWEALVYSYPDFIDGMIFKFLNASTFDGYNPYRLTKDGFDWETIEPDNPWSYIGYWGDHQIIYLLKFLEFADKLQPGALEQLFDCGYFVYAAVPYRIKSYEDILRNPKNTIDFDHAADADVRKKVAEKGADGALLNNRIGEIHRVNFLEKILAAVLAKVSNFIPEGGIWMNTQRPEWNDANNALVGNGVSVVTLNYLRRFFTFFEKVLSQTDVEQVLISEELMELFDRINRVLEENQHLLEDSISNENRRLITDALGQAGSDYRNSIYTAGFSGSKSQLKLDQLSGFIRTANRFFEHTIAANRRTDHLYHAYNIMTVHQDGISISNLSEMLEGQVAAISSGFLSSANTLRLLDALRISALYRKDQNSYLLYPNKELPKFFEKNTIPEASVEKSLLLKKLVSDNNPDIIRKDVTGAYHFNGNFKNASDLRGALENMQSTEYKLLVESETDIVLQIFEEVFNHKAFTGRSGTFYAYEGLGSIYWHMVSKLHLAVQEACIKAITGNESPKTVKRLLAHYYEIGKGIGVHKSPDVYGAFPTDPYSHTPLHRGAQQPGMTGQVKEDILVRFGELGVFVNQGKLNFNPCLLRKDEFLKESRAFYYVNIQNEKKQLNIDKNTLGFTFCQIPVIYKLSDKNRVEVTFNSSSPLVFDSMEIDKRTSGQVFQRTGEVKQITVSLTNADLQEFSIF
ncbi:MAG: hypothetical protein CVU14_01975 [Bacteroidetes bacterium HGW-Bacteroidetes-9]|jgi:hypothetical protein|nr:MAG: hypothetical protein CVU14_01975 [Bacteroidetes bacterium HGW-Bacteroidetes-9]